MDRILHIEAASEYSGYSVSYLYQLIHYKKIPCYRPNKKKGSKVFFKESELVNFCCKHRQGTNNEDAEAILLASNQRRRRIK